MAKDSLAWFFAGLIALLAGLPLAYLYWPAPGDEVARSASDIGGAFKLTDHTGRTVTEETFAGEWTLVFFGFTHCPDICPTTLADISRTLQLLGERSGRVQPLFVTLDPQRDTPEVLAAYTAFFDERILALTGSEEDIAVMANAYGVYFERVPSGDTYFINHGTSIYLMDPDGQLAARFSRRDDSQSMARQITTTIDQG
ncbi:SCO family protein [Pseudomonas sp.]|jgi:protein SCO1|uniref:SCO family protein n=1 Tax=Pseudomonas sp. TaxID=306 RepID=UPI00272CD04A|nr:SCO family protein [Pseudomonas sp.]